MSQTLNQNNKSVRENLFESCSSLLLTLLKLEKLEQCKHGFRVMCCVLLWTVVDYVIIKTQGKFESSILMVGFYPAYCLFCSLNDSRTHDTDLICFSAARDVKPCQLNGSPGCVISLGLGVIQWSCTICVGVRWALTDRLLSVSATSIRALS